MSVRLSSTVLCTADYSQVVKWLSGGHFESFFEVEQYSQYACNDICHLSCNLAFHMHMLSVRVLYANILWYY